MNAILHTRLIEGDKVILIAQLYEEFKGYEGYTFISSGRRSGSMIRLINGPKESVFLAYEGDCCRDPEQ